MEELQQQVQAMQQQLQQQQQQMQQQLQQQQQERQQFMQQLQDYQQLLQQTQQQHLAMQQRIESQAQQSVQPMMAAFLEAMKQQTEALTSSLNRNPQRPTLIDAKGLGKPYNFDGRDEDKFLPWKNKTENYILGVFPDLQPALEWACEKETPIESRELDAAFGSNADDTDRISDLAYLNHQLNTVLTQLTEREPFDIVQNCGKSGLEAWRRLNRRYDPSTGGRKRNLLNAILKPGRQTLQDLSRVLEQWMDQVRRYERRKGEGGERLSISDDIKMGILESMVPDELENHLLMNRSRLRTFEDSWNEISLYVEARTGIKLKKDNNGAGIDSDPNAMDVGSLHQPKGKAKGKDKNKRGGKPQGSAARPAKFEGYCDNCKK